MAEGFAPEGDTVSAHRDDVTAHINNLWPMTFRELALDCGRDPSNSNIAIVKIVSDMRLAEATDQMRVESRRMRIATWAAVGVALIGVLVALVTAHSNGPVLPARRVHVAASHRETSQRVTQWPVSRDSSGR
jgi:hypothetical protein